MHRQPSARGPQPLQARYLGRGLEGAGFEHYGIRAKHARVGVEERDQIQGPAVAKAAGVGTC
jgi:hypothetical protein